MTTVALIRDLNNRYPKDARKRVIVCPDCLTRYTGDLARYFCPLEPQEFGCPECDRANMWLRFEDSENLPLAQRLPR